MKSSVNGWSALTSLFVVSLMAMFVLAAENPILRGQTQKIKRSEVSKPRNNSDRINRGRYIIEGVAACSDCHTPRKDNGESDRAKWLAGAPVFFQPARPVPGWPSTAPRLAGLPPGRDAEIVTLLTTGVWRDGKAPRPPMPRFHMTREDAEAVVAYLKSL